MQSYIALGLSERQQAVQQRVYPMVEHLMEKAAECKCMFSFCKRHFSGHLSRKILAYLRMLQYSTVSENEYGTP